ncbi:MAG: hypothetical protein Q8M01_12540 [Rubrivivax sp.]|nr:hypothetical protein [Rubrivivax sp.]
MNTPKRQHCTADGETALLRTRRHAAGQALLAAAALCLAAFAAPAAAAPGAKCPASTAAGTVTSQFSNNVLRCERRAIAQPVCPPTHLNYVVQGGQDVCKTVNIAMPPPGPLSKTPQCGPGMSLVPDGGAGNRDQCRGGTTNVMPMVGDF